MACAAFLEYVPSVFDRLPAFYEAKSSSNAALLRAQVLVAGEVIKARSGRPPSVCLTHTAPRHGSLDRRLPAPQAL